MDVALVYRQPAAGVGHREHSSEQSGKVRFGQSSFSYFVENPESLSHPLFVVGVGLNGGHGDQELGEVDLPVAVAVPVPDPVLDFVIGHFLAEAAREVLCLEFWIQFKYCRQCFLRTSTFVVSHLLVTWSP